MTFKPKSKVSPAEMEIFKILTKRRKGTVGQVLGDLPPGRDISYATVQTLLRRLEKKGCVRKETGGRAHVFIPIIRPENAISASVSDFVDRMFGGDAVALMQYLAKNRDISAADIEKLKNMVTDEDETASC